MNPKGWLSTWGGERGGGEGREGKVGIKGKLGVRVGGTKKKILGLVDTQQHDNMKLTIARRVLLNAWKHGLSK